MKKTLATLAFGLMAVAGLNAAQPSDYTIYINPGHGGYDSDDRGIIVPPYTELNENCFWESTSNLDKGLMLRDMLEAKGYKVVMSRIANTTDDDLGLSTIGRLANASGADIFYSIHSNATGTTARRNFPLILFCGDDDYAKIEGSKEWATAINTELLKNNATYWTQTSLNVRGDWDFYASSWGYGVGLGVLRNLEMVGMLSEGSFHDYTPETYRLMNLNYKWIEAWYFMKALESYLGLPGDEIGFVAGRINDSRIPREGDFKMFGDDLLASVDNVDVSLVDANGKVVATSNTGQWYNGVYLFKDVAPGVYTVKATCATHHPLEQEVTVTANNGTYANLKMTKIRDTAPEVIEYSPMWAEGDKGVRCNMPVVLRFNWDMDTESVEKAFSITPAVAGTFSWSEQNAVLTFTPTETYKTSTTYTVKIDATAMHADYMKMAAPFEMSFVTDDRDYMTILSQFPAEGDKVHYKGAQVEVRIDKVPNIASARAAITVLDSQGNKMTFNNRKQSYSVKGDPYGYFRLPFMKDLTVGETYTMTIANTLADTDGITIENPTVITFDAVDYSTAKDGAVFNNVNVASEYTLNEAGSLNMAKATVANNSTDKLDADAAVKFTYEFSTNEEDAEILWSYKTSFVGDVMPPAMTSSDAVGVHVYGDLTDNVLYLEMTAENDTKYVSLGKMDYLGWRYFEVPLTDLEGGKEYVYTGIKVAQTPSAMSQKGVFNIGKFHYFADGTGGVEDLAADNSNVTVYPNPASDYVIANADGLIQSVELISLNGTTVAKAVGNVLNVMDTPDGVYFVKVVAPNSTIVRKIVVKH